MEFEITLYSWDPEVERVAVVRKGPNTMHKCVDSLRQVRSTEEDVGDEEIGNQREQER